MGWIQGLAARCIAGFLLGMERPKTRVTRETPPRTVVPLGDAQLEKRTRSLLGPREPALAAVLEKPQNLLQILGQTRFRRSCWRRAQQHSPTRLLQRQWRLGHQLL